ncbi:4-amino-4-deoxy-L-arabinose transferase [Tardiphaga sp. 813_E8_N1_3]|uniref:4-amino-4-deoxy-L-arabinose transferase n=1 Tax=Tardiphaga sp. 813_E8_N1_3 TaxID=3240760 RepID=UPI003F231196
MTEEQMSRAPSAMITRSARRRSDTVEAQAIRPRPVLLWLLMLAAALRIPLAFWPNVLMPDEIYQFIEPAWRILGHDSFISWEWRYGIRAWTVPTLLAAPVALGDWLVPGGFGQFVASRLLAVLASLSIVASAWGFGLRISRLHAWIAGFVTAIWFEFLLFAPHTLGEPLATAMILPAAWLLTQAMPSRQQLLGAGALLALAFVCRFQFAPAIAVLVIGACWRHWQRLLPVTIGGAVVLIGSGIIDALHGAVPFAWVIANVKQNLLHGRADSFGTDPLLAYFGGLRTMWSLAAPLLVLTIALGWKRAPLLLAMALSNFVFHSLIGHKEQRFIFLSVAIFIIIAALGSMDLTMLLLRRRRALRRWMLPLLAAIWTIVSVTLACTGDMPQQWWRGVGAAQLASKLRHDPAMCSLALYELPYFMLPGRERLAGDKPVYYFDAQDPAVNGSALQPMQKAQGSFNRILSRRSYASDLPASFIQTDCDMLYDVEVCIYARSGHCTAGPASSFRLNDVLIRLDL